MKTRWITIIRHAKSSWNEPQLADKHRPLAKRGLNNASLMGENNAGLLRQVEQFYCSSGQRAVETLELMMEAANTHGGVNFADELYSFDFRQVVQFCETIDDCYESVAIVGHNPALTEFVNRLTDEQLYNLPTAAIARLRVKANSWRQLSAASGKLVYFSCPKNYQF